MMKIQGSDLFLEKLAVERRIEPSIEGGKSPAKIQMYKLTHDDGWWIQIGFLDFGFCQDVRGLEASDNCPARIHRLTHGLRMSVNRTEDNKARWCELSQAQMKSDSTNWSNLKRATLRQLEKGAGIKIEDFFDENDVEYGSRENILRDDSRRRFYWCLVFGRKKHKPAVNAFIYTRVLPVLNSYHG